MIIERQCVECEKKFEIREGEKEFYISKGLELPKRCFSCRKAKKNIKK